MSKYLYYKVEGGTESHAELQAAWDEFWGQVAGLRQRAQAMAEAFGFEKAQLLQDGFRVHFSGLVMPNEMLNKQDEIFPLLWRWIPEGKGCFWLRKNIPAKKGSRELRRTAAAKLKELSKIWSEHYPPVSRAVERDVYLKPLGLSCGDLLGQGGLGIFQSDDTRIFYIETNMPMPEFAVEILGSEYRAAKEKQDG